MPQSTWLPVSPKKVVLFPEIDQMKISLSVSTDTVKYVSKYIFFISKNKAKQKKQEYKKSKETREDDLQKID